MPSADIEQVHRRVIFLGFVGLGLFIGVYAVLLADLARAFVLNETTLGIVLGTFSGVGILSLLAGGRVADRVGRRPLLVAGALLAGTFLVLLSVLAGLSYFVLLAAVAFGGAGSSLYDLAVNSLGGDHERQHGVRAMTVLHAGWSAGAALGAFASGAALYLGADFRAVYAATGILLLLLGTVFLKLPLPTPKEASPDTHDRPEREDEKNDGADPLSSAPRVTLLIPGVLLATVLVTLTFLTDSALTGFSSLYLRDVLGSGVLLGGTGIAAFHAASLAGRLASARAMARYGERDVLVTAGLGAASGLALLSFADQAAIAALGLLVTGISLSPIVPVGFSIAARSAPGRSARAISVVTSFGYGVFLVGPVLVGILADLMTLRTALSLFVPISLLCAILVFWRLPR